MKVLTYKIPFTLVETQVVDCPTCKSKTLISDDSNAQLNEATTEEFDFSHITEEKLSTMSYSDKVIEVVKHINHFNEMQRNIARHKHEVGYEGLLTQKRLVS